MFNITVDILESPWFFKS